jgi:hypothetical protein
MQERLRQLVALWRLSLMGMKPLSPLLSKLPRSAVPGGDEFHINRRHRHEQSYAIAGTNCSKDDGTRLGIELGVEHDERCQVTADKVAQLSSFNLERSSVAF